MRAKAIAAVATAAAAAATDVPPETVIPPGTLAFLSEIGDHEPLLTAVVAWVRLAVRDHDCAFAREIFEVFLELLLDW